ncbi:MAG: polyprenyl synthetase family protein [Bacteroidetes bacterium]|nr:MAG: polyprenyl synthetase family protein [Bacteroidota bacterium]
MVWDKFEAYLEAHAFSQEPKALYEPANYIMKMGGKRIRPLLALLACRLFEEDFTLALPAALSVEVFHNFSLVHDDIMDAADLRRGRETVHRKYGINNAILTGDVMLIYAYEFLQKTPRRSAISDMVKVLSKVAIKVCEGQQYDVDFETQPGVSLADYIKMIELKTAALLAGSLQLGALAGGANEEEQQHLSEFGRLTGIAFQLQDDYLDTFGDPEKFGKRPGGDIIQNKKTALYIRALELADEPTRTRLVELYSQRPTSEQNKVEEVKVIFQHLDIPQYIKTLRNDYQQQAYAHLQAVAGDSSAKDALFGLAESLLKREI